jgi:hypothetical protein
LQLWQPVQPSQVGLDGTKFVPSSRRISSGSMPSPARSPSAFRSPEQLGRYHPPARPECSPPRTTSAHVTNGPADAVETSPVQRTVPVRAEFGMPAELHKKAPASLLGLIECPDSGFRRPVLTYPPPAPLPPRPLICQRTHDRSTRFPFARKPVIWRPLGARDIGYQWLFSTTSPSRQVSIDECRPNPRRDNLPPHG